MVMAVPFVSVNELGLNVSEEGATSLTTMVTSAVVLPPVLLAVTVYVAEEVMLVGVPLMAPVENQRQSSREEGKPTTRSPYRRWNLEPWSWPCPSSAWRTRTGSGWSSIVHDNGDRCGRATTGVAGRDGVGCGGRDGGWCAGDGTG